MCKMVPKHKIFNCDEFSLFIFVVVACPFGVMYKKPLLNQSKVTVFYLLVFF